MDDSRLECAPAVRVNTREKRGTAKAGPALANYRDSQSCGLLSAGTPSRKGWGGSRNRADRESWYLTTSQCRKLVAAAGVATKIGLAFNRHWTVHYERAGIAERNGARFVGHLLKLVSAQARRAGGELAAVWVRENGDGKGGHVHILMHLPAGMSLRNRTRRWIECAGGTYKRNVSKVRTIGRSIGACSRSEGDYSANLDAALAYLLKGAGAPVAESLGLIRWGEGGLVIGKRCGTTQNVTNTWIESGAYDYEKVTDGELNSRPNGSLGGDPRTREK